MHRTTACVVVNTPKVFHWLGHLPIMNWTVEQVLEVRGIDRVICLASSDLLDRAKKFLEGVSKRAPIETIELPQNIAKQGGSKALDSWLCARNGPAAEASVIAVLYPIMPFLPAAKIEKCVDVVLRSHADLSGTVKPVTTLTQVKRDKPVSRAATYIEVQGCRGFAPARVAESRFRPVPVSLIESLDVTDPDALRVANALVQTT